MHKEKFKFINHKEQEINRKKNFDFFKNLDVFKNDYIIQSVIRIHKKGLYNKYDEYDVFYIFNKDTTLIKVTNDENNDAIPLQVFDVKDFNTCGGGLFLHLYSKIDVEAIMKEIDIQLGD